MQSSTADTAQWNVTEPAIMETDKYLSSANAPDIEEDARLCIASGARRMVLNCAGMTYMTGAGVRAIMNIARMLKDAEGKLEVKGLNGQPRDIFLACGLDSVIPLTDESAEFSSLVSAA